MPTEQQLIDAGDPLEDVEPFFDDSLEARAIRFARDAEAEADTNAVSADAKAIVFALLAINANLERLVDDYEAAQP